MGGGGWEGTVSTSPPQNLKREGTKGKKRGIYEKICIKLTKKDSSIKFCNIFIIREVEGGGVKIQDSPLVYIDVLGFQEVLSFLI